MIKGIWILCFAGLVFAGSAGSVEAIAVTVSVDADLNVLLQTELDKSSRSVSI